MLRFAVFDEHGPAGNWSLTGAHILERDDAVVRGDISFKNGMIQCRKRSSQAGALCLLHDAGRMGRLMLQTCLLPDRDEPYILSLELARHRIKMFIAKSEEWQMFEVAADHPAMRLWERARVLFSEAIIEKDVVIADRLATESLADAIEATERLAMAHAEILLHRRFGSRPASSTTLGAGVWPWGMTSYREIVAKEFDLVAIPISWRHIEAEEGKFNWGPLDEWVTWAQSQSKPIIMGPLLNFNRQTLPPWMAVWQHDYDTSRDMAFDFMQRIVGRYRNVVAMWNVAAGLNVNDFFEFTSSQMVELVRMASLLVKQARSSARTMVELVQPFGEFGAAKRESLSPLLFLDRLLQEGVKLDAVGVQIQMGPSENGRCVRDLMQISTMLDRFFLVELPVMLTAVGVPSGPVEPSGGAWREAWSEESQSSWISRLLPVALSKPFVESIIWGDIIDHEGMNLHQSGLLTGTGTPKSALARLTGMRRRLRKPLGPLKVETRAGVFGKSTMGEGT